MNLAKLIEEAESLPVEERVRVVDSLLRTLNLPQSDIDEQWANVATKRLAEVRSGAVTTVPGDEVFKRIWKSFE